MPRYPHFLRAAKKDRFPDRLVAVAVNSAVERTDAPGVVEKEVLLDWRASGVCLKDGEIVNGWGGYGLNVESFWEACRYGMRHGQNTMVVTWGASRPWGLLGVWEAIESGRLLLGENHAERQTADGDAVVPLLRSVRMADGPDADQADGKDSLPGVHGGNAPIQHNRKQNRGRRNPVGGMAIVEDPPNILIATMPDAPGRLTMADLRNWGITTPPEGNSAMTQSGAILGIMLRMVGLLRSERMGGLSLTAGSQALHTYRRHFITHAVQCHTQKPALDLEAAAYYGGRCEVSRLGRIEGTVHHYDVRSMYPSLCRSLRVPVSLMAFGDGMIASDDVGDPGSRDWIVDATVETDEPAYPLRRDGRVIFPIGRFRTTLAGPEFDDAWMKYRIVKVHRWSCYRLAPALSKWATHILAITDRVRQSGDVQLLEWMKSLAVCLPGKFGQRASSWVDYPEGLPPGPWSQWVERDGQGADYRCRAMGWQAQREVRDGWAEDACPQIAAWITSAGRVMLLNLIRKAGWENVLYYDTDSLFVTLEGMGRLGYCPAKRDCAPGSLGMVESSADFHCYGVKHYRFAGRLTCSGRPKGTMETGPDQSHYWWREWLRKAIASGRRPFVGRILRKYARNEVYHGGNVDDMGRVTPLEIRED